MTLATDQNINPEGLSPNARRMLELRDEVLAEWMKRVRESIKEAKQLANPILINTFPSLYDNIAEAITPGYPRTTGNESNTVAIEHGGERARLTNYNVHSVISEYQILRWTIFDVLKANGVRLNDEEIYRINASIDGSIREAVTAFALAQLALRERFVAALTHDLRNPLSNAKLAAQLIEHSSDLDRIKEFTRQIVASLDRMDGMIQDLLDAARFQSGKRLQLRLEEFDMQELAKEVCEQFTFAHGPRFQLIARSARVWWDREAIKRAMENLMGNALKYGAPDTSVRIKIDPVHERVMVTVHNEGEPIPPEQMESLFQVFQRAAAGKEGWGIGLPYVRSVAESHGGSVEVDSAAPRGTTFMIDLPGDARPYQDAPTLEEKPD
ncbi:Signal transduction histidine kinase [Nitrosospira multiformis]|uniref:histidine kinase n=1 Tax=Nitrosospira multiformis TaxID=1231 RepID=A0A1H8NN93_9PROT|nr:HAMP domain-containing sensor histidine kinase [Nitrosospira multiformis]SEO31056.1 Signal transduction histidine kinase [Nitrosospira multiformis]